MEEDVVIAQRRQQRSGRGCCHSNTIMATSAQEAGSGLDQILKNTGSVICIMLIVLKLIVPLFCRIRERPSIEGYQSRARKSTM